jgi:hypothetical protein
MSMRPILLLSFLLIGTTLFAQKNVTSSSLSIDGAVMNEVTYTVSDLLKFPTEKVADIILYNHDGIAKDTLKNMKGIPLKNLLSDTKFKYESPKELGAFVFVLTAADGYTVTCSWNEIYNTEIGNHCYIITEMNGEVMTEMKEHIIFISTQDLKVNRRYVRGLEHITVKNCME